MVFWIAILAGGLFAWLAVRMGFYETWILLFNVVVSMYVGIFLAPAVVELTPATGGLASYGTALSMVVLAGGCFAILQGLSFVFLTGQFNIPFPRLLDIVLSGLLGFVAGFLALSFLALIVTASPLTERKLVGTLGFDRQSQKTNIACVAWCCDRVHALTRFEADASATQAAIDRLLTARDPSAFESTSAGPDVNTPSQSPASAVQPAKLKPADTSSTRRTRAGRTLDLDLE